MSATSDYEVSETTAFKINPLSVDNQLSADNKLSATNPLSLNEALTYSSNQSNESELNFKVSKFHETISYSRNISNKKIK
jgi:hypothetical protein